MTHITYDKLAHEYNQFVLKKLPILSVLSNYAPKNTKVTISDTEE
jgi:hypothetical protein